MRTWPRRRRVRILTAVLTTGGLVAAAPGTASADLIVNGVDDSVDTTVEVMPLSLSTGPGTTTIYVVPSDGDGDPGCNFDGASETVTVNIANDNPAAATVSPTTVTLSACGTAGAQTVTVTPVGVGTAIFTTTVAPGTNKTGGSFGLANARFSAKVTEVPNRPPTLDVLGVEEGGSYAKNTLARPSCVATDVDDFPEAPHTKTWPAPLTEISGPYAVDDIGTRYAMCTYVDKAGVQVNTRKGYSIVDESAPVISRTLDPTLPETGWFRGDVTLTHVVSEHQSPSSLQEPTGCGPVSVTEDTRLRAVTCSATSAGGTRAVTTNIRRDATAPAVSPTSTIVSGTPGEDGWYTSPVGVSFTATDPTSSFLTPGGTVSTTSTKTVTSTTEGEAAVVASPAFTDRAGNASAVGAASRTVKVDSQAPNAPTAVFSTPPNADGWHKGPVTVTFEPAGDQGASGVASCSPPVTVAVDAAAHAFSGTCTDAAGNESAAKQVTVMLDQSTPVVTQAVAAGTAGSNGWYRSDVDVSFTATDSRSGLATATREVTSEGEGAAVDVASPAFTDRAGNTIAAGALTKTVKVDKTAPAVPTFVGGPSGSHSFGEVPAAPTCTSSDTGSGLASCVVALTSRTDGVSVGSHTYTATATDDAGHTSTRVLAYTVLPWTVKGFTAPIDMGGTLNTVKGGSTVPAKFEIFAGETELTDTGVVTFSNRKIDCSSTAPGGEVETVTSGRGRRPVRAAGLGAGLRRTPLKYDIVAGQYQYSWKLPTGAGDCYELRMTAKDGSSVTADFKLM